MFDWLFGDRATNDGGSCPGDTVQLSLVYVADDFLALHNGGTAPARGIRVDTERSNIEVVNSLDETFDLAPGESWTFLIRDLGPWTDSAWQITVCWEGHEAPVCVPLPAGHL